MIEVNKEALTELIPGLSYNPETDDYTFKGETYRAKSKTCISEKSLKEVIFFVCASESTHIIRVITVKGIPVYDGFNEIPVDDKERTRYYNREYNRKNRTKKEFPVTICFYCGKEFKPEYHDQKYCSHECKMQATYEKRSYKYKMKKEAERKVLICPVCGKEFKQTQKQQKYCSHKCQVKAANQRAYAKVTAAVQVMKSVPAEPQVIKEVTTVQTSEVTSGNEKKINKVCPVCGKEFVGSKRTKYCSTECRNRQNQRDFYARIRAYREEEKSTRTTPKVFVVKKNR